MSTNHWVAYLESTIALASYPYYGGTTLLIDEVPGWHYEFHVCRWNRIVLLQSPCLFENVTPFFRMKSPIGYFQRAIDQGQVPPLMTSRVGEPLHVAVKIHMLCLPFQVVLHSRLVLAKLLHIYSIRIVCIKPTICFPIKFSSACKNPSLAFKLEFPESVWCLNYSETRTWLLLASSPYNMKVPEGSPCTQHEPKCVTVPRLQKHPHATSQLDDFITSAILNHPVQLSHPANKTCHHIAL